MAALEWEALRVLVVDPDDFFRTLVRTILRGVHVRQIREARSQSQAQGELLSEPPPQVVPCATDLTDGGWEGVAAAASRDAVGAQLILITSDASRDLIEAAREAGVNDLLLKPISAKQLLTRIARAVAATPRSETGA